MSGLNQDDPPAATSKKSSPASIVPIQILNLPYCSAAPLCRRGGGNSGRQKALRVFSVFDVKFCLALQVEVIYISRRHFLLFRSNFWLNG